eukprot:CAMPEP_0185916586 /NCGR_PEP_ID=MMETSP0924C-20121207/3616_1 /TAXON_ID=321610 /ORGANISM="Perkinsus chesapeaki, Strain ATCC PRA-65" /LENGTH=44 /DNA_ID= /DNA_START= /DNA_END= /DNA_ORIENTATION=
MKSDDDDNDDIAFDPECYIKELTRMDNIYNDIIDNDHNNKRYTR